LLFTDTHHHHKEPRQLRIKYKIGKIIGEGNFAVVKECTEKYVQKLFIMKIHRRLGN